MKRSFISDADEEESEGYIEEGDKELDKYDILVSKVKKFTVLFDMHNDDWTNETEAVIKEFFESNSEELLVIYYNELKLCAAFEFPEVPVHDIMYFLKEQNQEISPEHFHEEITFGSLNNSVEGAKIL